MTTYQKISQSSEFQPPAHWLRFNTIEMHTGGEPLRVILDGFPVLEGNNILEYRRFAKENYDHLRTALMFEPRGHADMYGCILLPPNDETGDFGILFLHNEGYSTMCGHAIIAISTLAIKMGWTEVNEGDNMLKIDAPCGRINSYVNVKNGDVTGVRFHCVPSFVVALDQKVNVKGLGNVTYDLAYGGAFYAYVEAAELGLELIPTNYNKLIQSAMAIKQAVIENGHDVLHPYETDLSFLYGTIFIGKPEGSGIDSRNVCIFADGEVDRSPTGSGVAGRMAIHYAKAELKAGEKMSIESITGSVFYGSVIKEIDYGSYQAVIPEIEGTAYITGTNTFLIDPDDPIKNGFLLR